MIEWRNAMGKAIEPSNLVPTVSAQRDAGVLNRLKLFWAPMFGYAVLLGGIYLHGYWVEFAVRPLEYIDASDILKVSAFPLALVLVLYLGSVTIGGVLGIASGLLEARLFRSLRFLIARIARHKGVRKQYFLVLAKCNEVRNAFIRSAWMLVIGPPLIFLAFSDEHRILLFGLSLACFIAVLAIYISHAPRSNSGLSALLFGAALVVFLPFAALDGGVTTARNAKRADHSTVRVDAQQSGLPLTSIKTSPVVYLGLLGETYFFLESATHRTVAISGPLKNPLFLLPPGTESEGSKANSRDAPVTVLGPR
jgi:hypothetical protein